MECVDMIVAGGVWYVEVGCRIRGMEGDEGGG